MFLNLLTHHPILYLRIVVITILSICLHELAHGVAALQQGDDTPRRAGHMTLNPLVHMGVESIVFLAIGGIAWGAMPVNPSKFRSRQWGDVLVSAAGPLSNLILGCLFVALISISTSLPISDKFLKLAALTNFSLFLFNCLPCPPLDGFHVFSKFIPGLKVLENQPGTLFILIVLLYLGLSDALYDMSYFIFLTIGQWMGVSVSQLLQPYY
jgi:Zn-dependent protease